MERKKEEAEFMFQNFFSMHKGLKQQDNKLEVTFLSRNQKDMLSFLEMNSPEFQTGKDVLKRLQGNNLL